MSKPFYPDIKYAPIIHSMELHNTLTELEFEYDCDELTVELLEDYIDTYPDQPELLLYQLKLKETLIGKKQFLKSLRQLSEVYPNSLFLKLEYCFTIVESEKSMESVRAIKNILELELRVIYGEAAYPEIISEEKFRSLLYLLANLAAYSKDEKLSEQLYKVASGLEEDFRTELFYRLMGLERDYMVDLDEEENEEWKHEVYRNFNLASMPTRPHYDFSYRLLNRDLIYLSKSTLAEVRKSDVGLLEADLRWILAQGSERVMNRDDSDLDFILIVLNIAALFELKELSNELLWFLCGLPESGGLQVFGDSSIELLLYPFYNIARNDLSAFYELLTHGFEDDTVQYCLLLALGHLYRIDSSHTIAMRILERARNFYCDKNEEMIPWLALAMIESGITDYNEWIEQVYSEGKIEERVFGPLEDFMLSIEMEHTLLLDHPLEDYLDFINKKLHYSPPHADFRKNIEMFISEDQLKMEERAAFYEEMHEDFSTDEVLYDPEERNYFMESETIKHDSPKISRNDPCPCGSGDKYKKCCWNKSS